MPTTHTDMRDRINELTPGQFEFSNAAELIAVGVGAYLIVEGRVNTGLMLIGAALGYDNVSKLRKTNDP